MDSGSAGDYFKYILSHPSKLTSEFPFLEPHRPILSREFRLMVAVYFAGKGAEQPALYGQAVGKTLCELS
jgi:hypothetical protein